MFFESNVFQTILLIWNVLLTGSCVYFLGNWRKIFRGAEGKDIKVKLEDSLVKSEEVLKKIKELQEKVDLLEKEKVFYLKKTAFLRFNPFGDTGGDQSFVWVCLDESNDGVIISSLHGRDSTRMYAKNIEKGESLKNRLSDEEEQVLELAIKGRKKNEN